MFENLYFDVISIRLNLNDDGLVAAAEAIAYAAAREGVAVDCPALGWELPPEVEELVEFHHVRVLVIDLSSGGASDFRVFEEPHPYDVPAPSPASEELDD